ncbi:universal stress protein [Pigmentiphaga litoralis]|uniref:Nucleotide-binding universal stress UspA family protein n=1 Tax=Pigmentiphaga litoralis TaxID=516702 RepID=A0A7Y9LLF5_9BURK|nr:universal stress protein [Pigmentiphaga litoralis]NYE22491.1 nucleotide-binding universal stress UspA family protein [Pigmentiphaga litoralis]NYE83894.1 nucleotide-binding universal stress UspA family protein [Pigmentiphaga litoralis]
MYRRIMLAVDGSTPAALALKEAIKLGKALSCEVHLVHVIDDAGAADDVGYFAPAAANQKLLDAGRDYLQRAAAELATAGVAHSERLIEEPFAPGGIAITIDQAAREASVDIIVMGTHGRRGVRRLLMGSVAEGVLRLSRVPVLLVQGEDDGPAFSLRRSSQA